MHSFKLGGKRQPFFAASKARASAMEAEATGWLLRWLFCPLLSTRGWRHSPPRSFLPPERADVLLSRRTRGLNRAVRPKRSWKRLARRLHSATRLRACNSAPWGNASSVIRCQAVLSTRRAPLRSNGRLAAIPTPPAQTAGLFLLSLSLYRSLAHTNQNCLVRHSKTKHKHTIFT